MGLPEITAGMDALRRDNPWPDLPVRVEPFYLALDAGGRHLVSDIIREQGVTLMVEIGCFLCGSTRQWLDSSPDLVVIGVDPWDGNWANYIRKKTAEDHPSFAALDDTLADTIQRYGNYCLALNNIRDERDRFIPVRQRSPEALYYLRHRGIHPQLIYIDAFKSDEDLWVAHDLFPRAILCGDDWNWSDEDGRLRMREHVERFAEEKGLTIEADGATWIVSTGSPPLPPPSRLSWDVAAARALVQEVDRTTRDLLRVVAADGSVTFDEACRLLDSTAEDLLLSTRRINEAEASTDRPQPLGLGGPAGAQSVGRMSFVLAEGLAPLLTPYL